jgi:heptosyltransferase III
VIGQRRQVWVFHRGALGDSVLLWPMLRAMAGQGAAVSLVSDGSKAKLAARELGITAVDAEQRRFTDLWAPGARIEEVPGVDEVVAFIGEGPGEPQEIWIGNVAKMFPSAAIATIQGRPDAVMARTWSARPSGAAAASVNTDGPVVLHVGAGSELKRWPLERFCEVAAALGGEKSGVGLIAGEVEMERLSRGELELFSRAGGMFIDDLEALAALLRSARLFLGCDSGPTHLAAQVGVPTLTLFGPTDPRRWGPVGPLVGHLAPPVPCPMEWLWVGTVLAAAREALQERG